MAMTDQEKNHLARVMAERDVARREALEATIRGELRGRGVTPAAARHLAVSFSHDTKIDEDGTLTFNGKVVDEMTIATAAVADAKLLGAGAWEPGHEPAPAKGSAKPGHAPDGRPLHELSVKETLALDAKQGTYKPPAF